VSLDLPAWVSEFSFYEERRLRSSLQSLEQETSNLKTTVESYNTWKRALCTQSEPLVHLVVGICDQFLGMKLVVNDTYVEDATLRDEKDTIIAVFEIKGVSRNFTRNDVNQLDSHRERLGLSQSTPGILIINTMMAVDTLKAKDERPHPDIIRKAVNDNVLLFRTLDLLRFVDGVERKIFTASDFRDLLLTDSGWLKVEGDSVNVVKQ
jgi:hypothetical protein